MNWDKFQEQFHPSWHRFMKPFVESDECDKIYKFLKSESQRGKKIAPLSNNVFRCFRETSYDDLKVIMMGMCPYHTFKAGSPIADGLLMGCSVTGTLQPSLEQFYGGLEKDLHKGLNLKYQKITDVSYLANQGVLMFNASLTTEANKAGSHMELWEPFTKYVLEEVVNLTGVPIIFLGKEAAKYQKYTNPFSPQFAISHPASASYKHVEWTTDGAFSKVNRILKDNNNTWIDWLSDCPF